MHAIELKGISKRFGTVEANRKISLTVEKGEILSLLGENGSGKTTLMNMLSGIYFPDEGQILIDGKEAVIRSPKDAYRLGIGMIHQHLKLIDVFTAAENIVLGLPGRFRMNWKETVRDIAQLAEKYGFSIEPNKKVYDMSISEKQTVEIVKMLYRGADILILDEPTAVLTPQETDRLFCVLKNMKQHGKAIIIITHKLNEVMELSDRVAVLRRGEYIGSVRTAETNELALTEMMVGRKMTLDIERTVIPSGKKRLEIQHLTYRNEENVQVLQDVSFSVRSGEILGIAGVAGSGQKELLETIAGLLPDAQGSISYWNPETEQPEELLGQTPQKIRQLGVALSFVPEDRLGMGLVGTMGMTGNMLLRNYRKGRSPFTEKKSPKKLAERVMKELEVSAPSISTPVRRLSGGNVQKVLVGREISSQPSVLMTAYAVRGLDINTSYTIYRLLNRQKENGAAVIYVGEDLDVLLELCDRILVMCGGQVSGIADAETATKEEIGLLMTKYRRESVDDEA